MTISEFLLARIEEDEAAARAATEGPWEAEAMDAGHSRYEMNVWIVAGTGDTVCDMDGLARSNNEAVAQDDGYKDAQHIARHDPARVLAECAAKRAIIRSYRSCVAAEGTTKDFGPRLVTSGMVKGLELAVNHLATAYVDHEDFQEEWS